MHQEEFINPKLKSYNLDTYYMKKSIFENVKQSCTFLEGDLLDVGCGKMPYREFIITNSKVISYVGLDIESAIEYHSKIKPDFTWNGMRMPFKDKSFDSVFSTEVFEHCPDLDIILSEISRVLKPGGKLFFTVPFLWPLHEVPHDESRYTPFHLERKLLENKFNKIKIESTGGWDASMAQMLGLWIQRSGKSRISKKIWAILSKPFISKLIKKDRKLTEFSESSMHTGFKGFAYKK